LESCIFIKEVCSQEYGDHLFLCCPLNFEALQLGFWNLRVYFFAKQHINLHLLNSIDPNSEWNPRAQSNHYLKLHCATSKVSLIKSSDHICE